jgi:putative tryptophan/tyrosine transport system substrate-binding protein
MIGRREFIILLGGAAAWRISARAQQPAAPVIGFLNGVSFGGASAVAQAAAVRQGLRETGYVEGQNVAIEYRSADGEYDRLPALAAELARQKVAVILAVGSTNSPQAAKAATTTIPIVFAVGSDPVATGLVTNLRRPEANLTGVTFNNTALAPKRLEIARALLPGATSIGYLRNSANPFDTDMAELTAAARTLGLQLSVFSAATDRELLTVFQSMAQQQLSALIVSTDASFIARRNQIVALAGHHAIPTIYSGRDYVLAGGLISYGVEIDSLHRQAGIYTGRILKGDKPADLPVVLPTKFELVINSKAAKELGLTIAPSLLAIADEVIE